MSTPQELFKCVNRNYMYPGFWICLPETSLNHTSAAAAALFSYPRKTLCGGQPSFQTTDCVCTQDRINKVQIFLKWNSICDLAVVKSASVGLGF